MSSPAPLIALTAASDIDDTLAGEHARLMRDVERRAAPVLSLLNARVWPHAELGALTSFLRTTLLRQISDEEVHLLPHDASVPPFAGLGTDHIRLRKLTTQLQKAQTGPCSPTELRRLVDELLDTLRRHLADERQVLAAQRAADAEVPAVAWLAAANQAWLPDDTSPVRIDLDALPAHQAGELCIERLLRLDPGQCAEVRARDKLLLQAVRRWLHDFDTARFGLDQVSAGQDHLLRVTCRHPNTPAGISYPADGRHPQQSRR